MLAPVGTSSKNTWCTLFYVFDLKVQNRTGKKKQLFSSTSIKVQLSHLNTGMLSKTQLLKCRCPTSEQVVSCKKTMLKTQTDQLFHSARGFRFQKGIGGRCAFLNGDLSSFFHRRLQGVEVRQGRREPHTKPLISSAVGRSTERLNLHSFCGQSA